MEVAHALNWNRLLSDSKGSANSVVCPWQPNHRITEATEPTANWFRPLFILVKPFQDLTVLMEQISRIYCLYLFLIGLSSLIVNRNFWILRKKQCNSFPFFFFLVTFHLPSTSWNHLMSTPCLNHLCLCSAVAFGFSTLCLQKKQRWLLHVFWFKSDLFFLSFIQDTTWFIWNYYFKTMLDIIVQYVNPFFFFLKSCWNVWIPGWKDILLANL